MTARGCKYSADSFCYVCGEFFAKRAKKPCMSNCIRAAEAYLHYFGMPIGDQDKQWAHMSSVTTIVALFKVG